MQLTEAELLEVYTRWCKDAEENPADYEPSATPEEFVEHFTKLLHEVQSEYSLGV